MRINFYLIKMNNGSFNIDYLSPTGLIGFWILFIGLIFTGIMFYYVFFRLNEDKDSYKDRKRKELEKESQKEKIARLYPKWNTINLNNVNQNISIPFYQSRMNIVYEMQFHN